ncbi:hypothetical protein [Streptomyces sp. LN325]|uniref:hypothetical protein n=1 Tax=Streptomyces sp. LN325 TaxID=3112976 RepID=UPI003713EA0E
MSTRIARAAVWVLLPAEAALLVCAVAGVRIPGAVLVGAGALVMTVLAGEAVVVWRLYAAGRRTGVGRRDAARKALHTLVPVVARRLVVHEVRALHSLGLWVLRRRHQVPDDARAVAYTGPQTAMMYGLLFVSFIETTLLALVIPWPLVHAVLLVVDVYGVVLLLALHAGCVVRPHVVGPDGSLRLRYGALFDLRGAGLRHRHRPGRAALPARRAGATERGRGARPRGGQPDHGDGGTDGTGGVRAATRCAGLRPHAPVSRRRPA